MLMILLRTSFFMSVTIVMLIVFVHLFRHPAMARWRYICWVFVVFGLLIPFRPTLFTYYVDTDFVTTVRGAAQLPLSKERATESVEYPYSTQDDVPNIANITHSIQSTVSAIYSEATETPNPMRVEINRSLLIIIIWGAGFTCFVTLFMIRHIRFLRLIKRWGRFADDAHLLDLLESVRKIVGLKQHVKLCIFPVVDTPIITGFFKPMILLPEDCGSNTEFMLTHELIHCKRGDVWIRALLLLAWALHWFNPLMFLMNRYMSADCEISCDQAVLRQIGNENRLRYGQAVLNVARKTGKRRYVILPAFASEAQNLKKRLASIVELKVMKRRTIVLCTLMLTLTTVSSILLTSCGAKLQGDVIPDVKADLTQTDELVLYLPEYKFSPPSYLKAVDVFKAQYPGVNVTINWIGDLDNDPADQYQAALSMDLMAGSGPDVILTDYFTSDLYKVMDTGVFLNMNSIIKEDASFKMDDYNTTILAAGYYKDGQYIMPTSYTLPIMLADQDTLDNVGFDLSKAVDATSFLSEVNQCLPKLLENPMFGLIIEDSDKYYNWRIYDLSAALFYASDIRLIDETTNNILPDEAAFRAFCEAFQPFRANDMSNTAASMRFYEALSSGAALFEAHFRYIDFAEWSILNDNGKPVWTAVPSKGGQLKATACTGAAINANSKNHLNAWNYIKILLSEQVQTKVPGRYNSFKAFPVNKAVLSKEIESQTDDGSLFEGVICDASGTYFFDTYLTITADEKSQYEALHEGITNCSLKNEVLYNFFDQCMTPYFKGDKSLDECIADLKTRLKIYVSE